MKTYRKTLTIVLLALLVSVLIPVPAFAAAISVETDKTVYALGDLVIISGIADASAWIAISVKNPLNTPIYTSAVQADALGDYEKTFGLPIDAMTGEYTVDVSITGAQASITFTVGAAVPDFVVSVAPASASVLQGESTSATVTVTDIEIYALTVTLSASGQPTGVTVSFAPTSDIPTFTSDMTIDVAATAALGSYPIIITGTGTDDEVHTATYTLTVTDVEPENEDPVADAGGPYDGFVGDSISFDGSGSTDDGTIESYLWDFGDGETAEVESPSHTYDDADIYTVTLTVTDDEEATNMDTTTATVIEVVAQEGFSIDYVTPGDAVYDDTLTVKGSGVTAGNTVNVYWDYVTAANLLNVTTGLPSG